MSDNSLHVEWLSAQKRDRIPVVFIHGFLGSGNNWAPFGNKMDRPVLVLDVPGHGQSPSIDAHGPWFEQTTRRFIEVLDRVGIAEAHLVGYSMGGRIAMHVAKSHPSRIRRVVLESCHPGLLNATERAHRLSHDKGWSVRINTEWPKILKSWYDQPIFSSNQAFRPAMIEEISAHNPVEISKALVGFSLGHQEPIEQLNAPVLYLSGALDEKYQQIGRQLEAKNKGPESPKPRFVFRSVKGAGHNVHLEQPDVYLSHVRKFLNQDPL